MTGISLNNCNTPLYNPSRYRKYRNIYLYSYLNRTVAFHSSVNTTHLVHICIYVYIYIYMLCIYVYMYIYICCAYMYILHVYIWMWFSLSKLQYSLLMHPPCVHLCMCKCVYFACVCMCVCACACACVCMLALCSLRSENNSQLWPEKLNCQLCIIILHYFNTSIWEQNIRLITWWTSI